MSTRAYWKRRRHWGFRRPRALFTSTSPIAIRLSLPAYGNDIISMTKATALASTVTLLDMTGVARTIMAKTFAPYEVFISAAIIYIGIAWMVQKGYGMLEKRMSRYLKATAG